MGPRYPRARAGPSRRVGRPGFFLTTGDSFPWAPTFDPPSHSTPLNAFAGHDVNQISLPSEVTPTEIVREASLGGAIDLCAKVAGFAPKQVQDLLKTDKAQFSRWTSGAEGIVWSKLVALMDLCGNDAPLLWMLHARGYDLSSLRKRETETERENRHLREEVAALRRVLQGGVA